MKLACQVEGRGVFSTFQRALNLLSKAGSYSVVRLNMQLRVTWKVEAN
jgi:hypothetical protein